MNSAIQYVNEYNVRLNFDKTGPGAPPSITDSKYRQIYNGHTYVFCSTPATWYTADTWCKMMGGHLAYVESEDENTFLVNLCEHQNTWLGASDAGCEGWWFWGYGNTLNAYNKWHIDPETGYTQPDNWANIPEGCENYCHLRQDGLWNDAEGSELHPFICEIDRIDSRTVTYIGNGGTIPNGGNRITDSVVAGTQIKLPQCEFKAVDGFGFKCWEIDNKQYLPGDKYIVNSDTYIYAIWEEYPEPSNLWIKADKTQVAVGENITFTYGADNANIFVVNYYKDGEFYDNKPMYSETTCTTSFNKAGNYQADILAWYSTDSGQSEIADSTERVSFVVVQKTCLITLEPCGGSVSQTVISANAGEPYGDLPIPDCLPDRVDYQFAGWYTAANGGSKITATTKVQTGDHSIYAHWTALYQISYDANGGSGAPAAQTKTHDAALTLSSTEPTRERYVFKGWAVSANGSVLYHPGDSYSENAAVTLYAVWEKIVNWSDWYTRAEVDALIASGALSADTVLDEGMQYRYQYQTMTSYQDSNPTAPEGYETSGPEYVGNWGEWSAWQETPVSATATREVMPRQGGLDYKLYTYGRWTDGYNSAFCNGFGAAKYQTSNWRKETITTRTPYETLQSTKYPGRPKYQWHQVDLYGNVCQHEGTQYERQSDYDSNGIYLYDSYNCKVYAPAGHTDDADETVRLYWWYWVTTENVYKTEYAYRDQIPVYTHSKWETGAWTAWGEAVPFTEDAQHERDTETRTMYRYDLDAAGEPVTPTPSTHIEVVSRNGTSTTATIICDVSAAWVLGAAYDGDGKMTAVEIKPAVIGESLYSFSINAAHSVRIFVLEAQFRPLCEYVEG